MVLHFLKCLEMSRIVRRPFSGLKSAEAASPFRLNSSWNPVLEFKRAASTKAHHAQEKYSKAFAFGKFSKLAKPDGKLAEIAHEASKNVKSFDALRIFPTVRAAMIEEIKRGYNLKSTYVKDKSQLDIKPSPVQIAAIKKINRPRVSNVNNKKIKKKLGSEVFDELVYENELKKHKVFLIAGETGSGKTWAYLAPLLSKLKDQEFDLFKRSPQEYYNFKSSPRVRSVILLPTHELVEQVYNVIERANKSRYDIRVCVNEKLLRDNDYENFLALPENRASLNIKSHKWSSGDPPTALFKAEGNGVDVLVTTPAKLSSLGNLKNFSLPFSVLQNVESCVVDEADTLLDRSWFGDTTLVLQKLSKCRDLIFCSATVSKDFQQTINSLFPDKNSIIKVTSPSLHKIPRQIIVKVIDAQLAPYNGSKIRCLAQALYAILNDGTEQGFVKRVLVFVNEKKDVQPLVETLIDRFGHRPQDIIGITGQDSPEGRREKLNPFVRHATPLEEDPYDSKIKVLVTTDLLARGTDFSGVKNVILMDLPNNSVDLVHRMGRTGRMRQSGRVFIIIDKRTGRSWIKGLPKIVRKGILLG